MSLEIDGVFLDLPWHAEQMALSFKHGFWANTLDFLAEIRYGTRASLCPQHYQAFFHLELRWPGYFVSNLSIQQLRETIKNEMLRDESRKRRKRELTHAQMVKTNVKTTTTCMELRCETWHTNPFKLTRKQALNEKCLVMRSSTRLVVCIFFSKSISPRMHEIFQFET